jgi:negative regulator of flagellin synthesis FlgM
LKITNCLNIQKILNSYRKTTEGISQGVKWQRDKVEISEKARDFQVAMNAYKNLPEIRKEKVEGITRQIQSGNYNPSGEEMIEHMFQRKR